MWPPVTHLVILEVLLPVTSVGVDLTLMRVSVAKYPALNVGIVTSMASVTKNTGGSRYRVATVLLDSSYQWMASWLFDLLQIFIYQVAISWENWPGVVLSVI